jgi:hypothetical protein
MPRKSGHGVIVAELAARLSQSGRDSRSSAGDRETPSAGITEELEQRRRALCEIDTPPRRGWPHVERLP